MSRRVGLPAAAVVVAAVLALAAWLLLARQPGPGLAVAFQSGGFALDLPGGWVLGDPGPASATVWAQAERPTRAGTPDAWLWIARWSPSTGDALRVAADAAAADVAKHWGDVEIERTGTRFQGERAIALRYSRPLLDLLPAVPGVRAEELRVVTINDGQVYEIGIGGWRRLPKEAAALDEHLRLLPPRGTRVIEPRDLGLSLTVPAGWNENPSAVGTDPGLAWVAQGGHHPPSEWAMLWVFDTPLAKAVADSVAAAERDGSITDRTDTVIAGRPGVRIRFEQPTPWAPRTFMTAWHFKGPDGRAWQLLVAGVEPPDRTATMIEEALAWVP